MNFCKFHNFRHHAILVSFFVHYTAQQIHCPGDTVSISCTSSALLIWRGSALNGQCNQNNIVLEANSLTVENISDTFVCGDFTATLTNLTSETVGTTTIVTLVSSLTVTATPSLDGTTISCSDGVNNVQDVQLTLPGMSVMFWLLLFSHEPILATVCILYSAIVCYLFLLTHDQGIHACVHAIVIL